MERGGHPPAGAHGRPGLQTRSHERGLNRQLLAEQPDNAPAIEVAAGDHRTLVRTADGKVFSFGRGFDGQLGHGDTKQVSIPSGSTQALRTHARRAE